MCSILAAALVLLTLPQSECRPLQHEEASEGSSSAATHGQAINNPFKGVPFITDLSAASFNATFTSDPPDRPCIVEFYASWCAA